MERQRFYFGFRYDYNLAKRITRHCSLAGLSLNRFVEKAFSFAAHLHDERKIVFKAYSGFCSRPLSEEKVTTMLILKVEMREMVRNFAICYRRSMAEILRVSIEVYLDSLDLKLGKIDSVKHYYGQPQAVITQTLFTLFPAIPVKIPWNSFYPTFLKSNQLMLSG